MRSSFFPKCQPKITKISALEVYRGQGRNLRNFWLALWEKRWPHKFIPNLTDLLKRVGRFALWICSWLEWRKGGLWQFEYFHLFLCFLIVNIADKYTFLFMFIMKILIFCLYFRDHRIMDWVFLLLILRARNYQNFLQHQIDCFSRNLSSTSNNSTSVKSDRGGWLFCIISANFWKDSRTFVPFLADTSENSISSCL